ncbi:hypothetical protein SI65_10118 [Aspergillus cristatus]|uniref:Uncharacterized protein n=1 Tax=Aspergillus cristatus TaxID=573508 RepID=A0A1E3B1Y2_ASPCR|nr:hypothetical protein SI65_10118 [Aspergillus cristatus]
MSLLSLPNEVLFLIADSLEYSWNISALSQANHHLYSLLNCYAFQHNVRYFDRSVVKWAIDHDSEIVMSKMLDAGAFAHPRPNDAHMRNAALKGRTKIVRLLLERELLSADDCETLINHATVYGQVTILQLLRERARLSFPGEPLDHLSRAKRSGNLNVIKIYVEELSDHLSPDVISALWSEQLRSAARRGCLESVQELLRLGANPNPTSRELDKSALTIAAECGYLGIVGYLLEYGADAKGALERSRVNPIYKAIVFNHVEVAKLLFKHMQLDTRIPKTDDERALILCLAACCGLDSHVRHLLSYGPLREKDLVDFSFDDHGRVSPLEKAASFGHREIVALLLREACLKPSQKSLFQAAKKGHEPIVKMLLDHGADPNAKHPLGFPPLFAAVGHEDVFRLLLQHGADPTNEIDIDDDQISTVSRVIQWGETNLIELLLHDDVSAQYLCQLDENDILRWAMEGGSAMLQYLLEKGILKFPSNECEKQSFVRYGIREGLTASLDFILDKDFDMPQLYDHLFDYFFEPCSPETLDVLLKHGLDINKKDRDGYTALLQSVEASVLEHVRYFLEKGADPLIAGNDGKTSLLHAVGKLGAAGFRLMVQSIDLHSRTQIELHQETTRCLAAAVERKDWNKVRTLERFRVKVNMLAN